MNYLKHYLRLVRRAENRDSSFTGESHHVFPRAVYGENKRTVMLTYREHYIAHVLLWFEFRKRFGSKDDRMWQMFYAVTMMNMRSKKHARSSFRLNSRLYDSIRAAFVERMTGDGNPAKRPEVREKISLAKTGKSRPDMKGKSYFGASPETILNGTAEMVRKKTGMKIPHYPKNRKRKGITGPNPNIANARKASREKMIRLTEPEFIQWMEKTPLYREAIRVTGEHARNSNFTRVLAWRGIDVDKFYNIYEKCKNDEHSGTAEGTRVLRAFREYDASSGILYDGERGGILN